MKYNFSRERGRRHKEKNKRVEKSKGDGERTVFVRNLDMEEEQVETRGVGADDLLESPFEGPSTAYGCMRIAIDG